MITTLKSRRLCMINVKMLELKYIVTFPADNEEYR